MALRNPQALIATFTRAGVLCLGSAARTCVAHGLPETPDIFGTVPLSHPAGTTCTIGWFLESWDSASVVFVTSHAAHSIYFTAQVVHSRNE